MGCHGYRYGLEFSHLLKTPTCGADCLGWHGVFFSITSDTSSSAAAYLLLCCWLKFIQCHKQQISIAIWAMWLTTCSGPFLSLWPHPLVPFSVARRESYQHTQPLDNSIDSTTSCQDSPKLHLFISEFLIGHDPLLGSTSSLHHHNSVTSKGSNSAFKMVETNVLACLTGF